MQPVARPNVTHQRDAFHAPPVIADQPAAEPLPELLSAHPRRLRGGYEAQSRRTQCAFLHVAEVHGALQTTNRFRVSAQDTRRDCLMLALHQGNALCFWALSFVGRTAAGSALLQAQLMTVADTVPHWASDPAHGSLRTSTAANKSVSLATGYFSR